MLIKRDHLWKTAFHTWMPEFIQFFFDDQYDAVDWSKGITFLDKELNAIILNSKPKNRIADILVRLNLKNNQKLIILLHIEIQGYFDKEFAFRVHQMRYRIEAHVKFGKSENYRKFEQKIDKMAKFQTTAEIAEYFFDTDRRVKDMEKEIEKAKKLIERTNKKVEQSNKKVEQSNKKIERSMKETERNLKEAERNLKEKERTLERGVLAMLGQGLAKEKIAKIFDVTIEIINVIEEKYKDNNPIMELLNGHAKK